MLLRTQIRQRESTERDPVLTGREDVVVDNHRRVPARAVHEGVPRLLDGGALHPDKQSAESHGDVGGHDDEPDQYLYPSVGQSEHGKSETRLGPGGGSQRECAREIDDKGHLVDVLDVKRHVPDVKAVAESRCISQQAGLDRDADLALSVSPLPDMYCRFGA